MKFTDDGYAPVIMYAQDDADEQASQVSDMTEKAVSAMVIAPVDPYGLSEELKAAKEAEIPVIAYDDLIMNTDGVKYYVTFGGLMQTFSGGAYGNSRYRYKAAFR